MNNDMPGTIRRRFIVSGNVQEAGYRVFVKPIAKSMGVAGFVRNLPDETVEVVCEAEPGTLEKFIKAIDRKGNPANPQDINVVSIVETPAPAEGKYATFAIEYDGKLTAEERERNRDVRAERMVVGASMLRDEVSAVGKDVRDVGQKVDCLGQKMDGVGKDVRDVGQKVDCLGQKMDGVGKDVREVGQAVHGMHSDMNTRFDHMAEHYDMIAISLKEAIAHMDRNAEKTDRAIEKSRKESAAESARTRKEIAKSRKETVIEVRKSQKETAKILAESRKEVAASNRELAKAVNFMIRKLSDKPARKPPVGKRKR